MPVVALSRLVWLSITPWGEPCRPARVEDEGHVVAAASGVGHRRSSSMRASCEDDPSGVGPSPTCTNTRRRHRSNVVFFNRAALVKGRVPIPAQGYAMPAFLADLAKIRQSGGT